MDPSSRPAFDPSRLTKTTAAEYSSSASESEDEYLAPGLNDDDRDFDDFNPRKRRRIGGNNKEKAALGIFASDSEDDGPGKQWKRKTLRNKGMSFVSTAAEENRKKVKSGGEDSDQDSRPVLGNGRVSDDDDDDEEDDDAAGGVGLGFGRSAPGMGWSSNKSAQQSNTAAQDTNSRPSFKSSFNGGHGFGMGFVPSSEKAPILKEPAEGTPPPPRNKPQPSAFGAKGKINANSFGARMMAKMGYVEGKGLGKEGQGRNIIIEANLRPQGIGLGAVKEKSEHERQEEKRQAKLKGEEVISSDEEDKKRRKKNNKKKALGAAFDSAASTPRRQKTKYLTAEELKASAPGLHIPEAFTPILDMTGPGSKLLMSTSGIMTPTSGVAESAELIEARKLVKRAQADLAAFSEEWRSLEDRKNWVDLELREKEQELDDMRSDFERLQLFSELVSGRLVDATEWNEVVSCLKQAVEMGSATAEVADLAVAAMHPFFRESQWDPLSEPTRFASDLKGMAGLLMKSGNEAPRAVNKWNASEVNEDDVYRRHHKATTPYESMMYKVWLPQVLTAVRAWDPVDPTPMLAVIEAWNDLLPPFVRAQFVNNVTRKLETAISDWNPRKKRQSQGHNLPHTWLFPWLQYLPPYHLDARGTGIVAEVKRKFRQLIGVWEFERGVVPGLAQWQDILGEDQWRPLIMSHVLPSMGRYLRTHFRVDPADQAPYLPILTGMLKWTPLLGEAIMAEVLVHDMMPMWNDKLREWLRLDEVDLAEVAEWYGWWRGVVLRDFAEAAATTTMGGVSAELDKGLIMLNMV